jgi:hypothetical protein
MPLITTRKDKSCSHIFKYNHVHPEFTTEVNEYFKKLDILKYYPYGPETTWEYWLCGKVNLKKEYLDARNKHKTEWDYVFSIVEETARAMNYLMTHGNDDGFDHQRLNAFALWHLFHSGDCGWSKKNLKGLTTEQKTTLFWKGQKDAEKLSAIDPATKKINTSEDKETVKIRDNWLKASLKTYGVYEVRRKPLIQYSNSVSGKRPVVLYTKQELAAINLMVSCAFENLC